jgi:Mn-containing catalase
LRQNIAAIWGNGEMAPPGDSPGELEVVEGVPHGGNIPEQNGMASAFTPEYAPEEMFEIAKKLCARSR